MQSMTEMLMPTIYFLNGIVTIVDTLVVHALNYAH